MTHTILNHIEKYGEFKESDIIDLVNLGHTYEGILFHVNTLIEHGKITYTENNNKVKTYILKSPN